MTADKRADILSLARKTIHTEALALKHLEQTLGDDFVCAVELILHSLSLIHISEPTRH